MFAKPKSILTSKCTMLVICPEQWPCKAPISRHIAMFTLRMICLHKKGMWVSHTQQTITAWALHWISNSFVNHAIRPDFKFTAAWPTRRKKTSGNWVVKIKRGTRYTPSWRMDLRTGVPPSTLSNFNGKHRPKWNGWRVDDISRSKCTCHVWAVLCEI